MVSEQAEKLVEVHEVNKDRCIRSQQRAAACSVDVAKKERYVQQAQVAYQHAIQARNSAASRASEDENVDLSSYDAIVAEAEYELQNANSEYMESRNQYKMAVAEYQQAQSAIEFSGKELQVTEGQLRNIEADYHEKSLYLAELVGMRGGENAAQAIRHFKSKRKAALILRNKVLRSLGLPEDYFVDDSDAPPGVPVLVKKYRGKTGLSRGGSNLSAVSGGSYSDGGFSYGSNFSSGGGNSGAPAMAGMISYGNSAFVNAVSNAPKSVLDAIESVAGFISGVSDTDFKQNENGEWVKEGSYYSPKNRSIRLDGSADEDSYANAYIHESFHAYDHKSGWLSQKSSFRAAVEADRDAYHRGQKNFQAMLDDAFATGAAKDRAVSDILSAVFNNHPDVVSRYYDEIVPYYRHDNNYWRTDGNIEAEIFAECGCVMTYQNEASMRFLEKWFPSIDSSFRSRFDLLD